MAHRAIDVWAGRDMRLDPYKLPQKVHSAGDNGLSYNIDRNGAVLKRKLQNSKLPISIALPAKAFKGVAAKATELPDGTTNVTLELLHHDPACCLPLLISDNLDDIAADWHAWSRMLKLPMLLIGDDNEPTPVCKKLGALMIESPIERRKKFSFLKRRPNFLRRRKMGDVGKVEKLTAAEIIARR